MSCKSGIYVVNTTAGTAIGVGSSLPLTNIVRRFGCSLDLGSNEVIVKNPGYYDVEAVAIITATAVGSVSVYLAQDGSEVPGTRGTVTVQAIGDEVIIPINALVRVLPCNTSTLELVVADNAVTTVRNNLEVTKL